MTGRCEICGKENAHLLCLYDLHICEEYAKNYRKRTEKGGEQEEGGQE